MKLHFIRHGESLGNVDHSTYYRMLDCDVPLTTRGIQQSHEVGRRLASLPKNPRTYLYYSPYNRAKATADIIDSEFILDGFYCDRRESPLLVERSWGNLRDCVDNNTVQPETHFNFFYRPSDGESLFDVYQRVNMFFQNLRYDVEKDADVIIVSHGEWISLALMYCRKYSVEYFSQHFKELHPKNACHIIENM